MNQRPASVTIIGWLYLAIGAIDFASQFPRLKTHYPFPYDILWIEVVGLIAILCGAHMLRGRNWARWVALAWIGFHVVLSAFHTLPELAIHSLFLAVLAYFLLRPTATCYFRPSRT
jgi:hypothetical protein